MRRSTGEIGKIESKRRLLESSRDFCQGPPTSNPFAFNLSLHPRNRLSSERQRRSNKRSPLGSELCLQGRQRLRPSKPLLITGV